MTDVPIYNIKNPEEGPELLRLIRELWHPHHKTWDPTYCRAENGMATYFHPVDVLAVTSPEEFLVQTNIPSLDHLQGHDSYLGFQYGWPGDVVVAFNTAHPIEGNVYLRRESKFLFEHIYHPGIGADCDVCRHFAGATMGVFQPC